MLFNQSRWFRKMVKEIDLRKCVDFSDKKYVVKTQLYEKNIPIYSIVIYEYIEYIDEYKSERWRSIYSEYYSKVETAIERHNYISNNINEFIERN